jgi:hypothetical protein
MLMAVICDVMLMAVVTMVGKVRGEVLKGE